MSDVNSWKLSPGDKITITRSKYVRLNGEWVVDGVISESNVIVGNNSSRKRFIPKSRGGNEELGNV